MPTLLDGARSPGSQFVEQTCIGLTLTTISRGKNWGMPSTAAGHAPAFTKSSLPK